MEKTKESKEVIVANSDKIKCPYCKYKNASTDYKYNEDIGEYYIKCKNKECSKEFEFFIDYVPTKLKCPYCGKEHDISDYDIDWDVPYIKCANEVCNKEIEVCVDWLKVVKVVGVN